MGPLGYQQMVLSGFIVFALHDRLGRIGLNALYDTTEY